MIVMTHRAPVLGLVAVLLLSVSAPAQPQRLPTSPGLAPGEGERFRAELLAAATALEEVQSLTGGATGALDLAALSESIDQLDSESLAAIRQAIVAEAPGWGNVVTNFGAEIAGAAAAARLEDCSGDLEFSVVCGAPTGTVVRQVVWDVWYVLDIGALTAQGICDGVPTGCLCPANTVACPIAAVLKILARTAQGEFDFLQFCAGEGSAVTLDAVHCHLDDEYRFTDNDELAAQTDTLLAKMQEILDQLSGLQRATCDVGRLVTTPSGLRYSDLDVCQGEPGWPYDWNRNGVGVSGGASAGTAPVTGALELEGHLSRGTLLTTLYLPASAGGMLEQVRELVARRISGQERIAYAPEETSRAGALLQEADRLQANRDYVRAYKGYGAAYRALIPAFDAEAAGAPEAIAPAIESAPSGAEAGGARIDGARLPTKPGLGAVVPNPVTGSLRYSVRLPVETLVTVRVYSVDGRLVGTLVDGSLPAGATELGWEPEGGGVRLASGVYFLRLDAAGVRESRKFVVTR